MFEFCSQFQTVRGHWVLHLRLDIQKGWDGTILKERKNQCTLLNGRYRNIAKFAS